MGLEHIDIGHDETIRHERPELPPMEDVARYYAMAEEVGVYSGDGPCRRQLAGRLASYAGAEGAVPVASGPLGLLTAMRGLFGLPTATRRLVAVQSFTQAPSASAITWAGFEPLFIDVEEDSWQLDPLALADALERHGESCAGILAGATCGTAAPARLRAHWREVAAAYDMPLLIDSGPGLGAVDDCGRRIGGCGDTEVFSLRSSGPFAIGEGGVVLTPDRDQAELLQRLAGPGLRSEEGTCIVGGLGAGMSELAAAVGLAMLDCYDDTLSRRRWTATQLQDAFARHPITYQAGFTGSTWPAFHLAVPHEAVRERTLALAAELKIEVRRGFDPPLHVHPAFAGAPRGESLEVTERLAARVLSLPLANSLGARQVVRLAELLEGAFEWLR